MTKEALASLLNGRAYTKEITDDEAATAKANGLVVLFGASDDLCELRGAIYDEVDAYDSTTVLIGTDGKFLPELEDEEKKALKKHGALKAALDLRKAATKIQVRWCHESEPDYSWTLTTDAPHAPFDIMEDGGKFCRGLVIDLKELA